MARDVVRYDRLIEEALRGVVRDVLSQTVEQGLPGNHHFYITFRTGHPGVDISDQLHVQYPEEMTIVLQHQYWDLEVEEDLFRVTLSFNKTPEVLTIPYAAISTFADPSVQFGLQFQGRRAIGSAESETEAAPQESATQDAGKTETGQIGEIITLDSFRNK